MPLTLGQRRVRRLWKRGIGLPGDNERILDVARHLSARVDAPVLGGIAVVLHGYARSTTDLDLYTTDRRRADEQLRAAGAVWEAAGREHVFERVRIHTVTPDEAGHEVGRVSVILGIRVVSRKDLVAIKLRTGLRHADRAKELGDVQELIHSVPLDKTFAPKLPKDLRQAYKTMVDAVRAGEQARRGMPRF